MSGRQLILVVDDDRDIRESLTDALEEEGYAVVSAVDGLDALEQLRLGPALPDLVLLDLMMPRMNGFRFCVEVRAEKAWAALPIVVLTADAKARERTAVVGADGYLQKPVKLDALYATVSRMARKRAD